MCRKENPNALLVEMQIGAATVESSMETPQKIKNGSTFWPSDPTSGNVSEGIANTHLKEHKHLYVHFSVTYNGQCMEAAQVSISGWVGKTSLGHLHNGILLGHKKEENFTIVTTRMDLENIMLSEISQSEKDKYHMISLMWNLMNKLESRI